VVVDLHQRTKWTRGVKGRESVRSRDREDSLVRTTRHRSPVLYVSQSPALCHSVLRAERLVEAGRRCFAMDALKIEHLGRVAGVTGARGVVVLETWERIPQLTEAAREHGYRRSLRSGP